MLFANLGDSFSSFFDAVGSFFSNLAKVHWLPLLLALAAQLVLNFRNGLAARYPCARPVLGAACAALGCRVDLPADATEADVRQAIERLNSDPAVTGYIVQLPLPAGIDENAMLELIDPSKDADGLHPTNLGRLVLGVQGELTSPLPCTPAGIVEMLQRYDVPIVGQHVVVVGRGLTVGRPLGLLLTRKGLDATVTLTQRQGDWWVTVVGDTPPATLKAFAAALERKKP